MKTTKKLAIVLAVALLGAFAFSKQALNEKTVTTVSIIADYKMPNTPDNDTILCDFVKVMKAKGDHIFINSSMWYAFLDKYVQGKVTFDAQAWEFYDTNVGLIYIRNTATPHHEGIQYQQFKRIANPLDLAAIDAVVNANWTADLDKIFNVSGWQAHQAGQKNMIYLSGHGAQRPKTAEYTSVGCGILSNDLVKVALFFNNQLNVDTLVINSCYWTADRLRETLHLAGAQQLNYTVISPLLTEEMLWLTSDLGCECERCMRDCPSFFETCRTFTGLHEADITPELSTLLCSSDTALDNIDKMQAPTLVMAGTTEPVAIQA